MVNVSRTVFNEWAIEVGGEEAIIVRYGSGQEVVNIGVPHKSKSFGFIQKGLPQVDLDEVKVTATDSFIDSPESQIIKGFSQNINKMSFIKKN